MTGRDIRQLVVYLNNTAPLAIAEAVYGGPDPADVQHDHGDYLVAKAEQVRREPLRWLSSLDTDRLAMLAALATPRGER